MNRSTPKTESRQGTKSTHFVKTEFLQLVGEGVDPRLSWLSGYIKRPPELKDICNFLGVSEQAAKKLRRQLKRAEWQGQSGYYLSSPAAVYLKPVAFRMLDRIYRQLSRCVKTGYRATLTAAKLAEFAEMKRFKPILEELQRAGFITIIRAERGKYTLSRGENVAAASPLLKQKPQKRTKKAIEQQNQPAAVELPLSPQSEQIEPFAALESQPEPEEPKELIALDQETPIEDCCYLEEQEQEPLSIGLPCSWELAQLEDQEIEAAEEQQPQTNEIKELYARYQIKLDVNEFMNGIDSGRLYKPEDVTPEIWNECLERRQQRFEPLKRELEVHPERREVRYQVGRHTYLVAARMEEQATFNHGFKSLGGIIGSATKVQTKADKEAARAKAAGQAHSLYLRELTQMHARAVSDAPQATTADLAKLLDGKSFDIFGRG